MAPGMREVAEKAGVSIATVSNVLNRPQVVTETTQRRVRAAMDELGFVRNGTARQLRAGKSEVVCVTVPGFTPFYDELIRGVEERAAEHGLVVFACATSDDPIKEESYLRVFMEQRVRGILLTTGVGGLPAARANVPPTCAGDIRRPRERIARSLLEFR